MRRNALRTLGAFYRPLDAELVQVFDLGDCPSCGGRVIQPNCTKVVATPRECDAAGLKLCGRRPESFPELVPLEHGDCGCTDCTREPSQLADLAWPTVPLNLLSEDPHRPLS